MTTKQVTVTKYISCDGREFNELSECVAHEREIRELLEHQAYELLCKYRKLKYAINEARIKARIARLDAENQKAEARSAIDKSKYCNLMSDYWVHVSIYNTKRRELRDLRSAMSVVADNLYVWFGLHKKKSALARLKRRKRSLDWRSDHQKEQWNGRIQTRSEKVEVLHPVRFEE